ncbi:hypothetical protein Tco_1556745 [Tanacetum coccineum]
MVLMSDNESPEPGDAEREVPDHLLAIPEDIYAAVDSCETAQEIWLRVQQMMKGSDIGIQEKKAKLFNEWKILYEIEESQCKLHFDANLQQASTSEPIPEPHQVQQNDSNVISEISSVEQEGGTVDQHPVTVEETRAYFESLYNNLALEVEKLSTEKSTVSSLLQEKKKLKSDFKIREDELLDKQIQLENKIKELDNILVKTGQSIQTMHMLSPNQDLIFSTPNNRKLALSVLIILFYLKQAQRKHQSLYDGKVLLEKHDPPVVHDFEETLQLAQETAKFVRDFKSLAKEADESLAKAQGIGIEIDVSLRALSKTPRLRPEGHSQGSNIRRMIWVPSALRVVATRIREMK